MLPLDSAHPPKSRAMKRPLASRAALRPIVAGRDPRRSAGSRRIARPNLHRRTGRRNWGNPLRRLAGPRPSRSGHLNPSRSSRPRPSRPDLPSRRKFGNLENPGNPSPRKRHRARKAPRRPRPVQYVPMCRARLPGQPRGRTPAISRPFRRPRPDRLRASSVFRRSFRLPPRAAVRFPLAPPARGRFRP